MILLHSILRHSRLNYLVDSMTQPIITTTGATAAIQITSQSTLAIKMAASTQQLQNACAYDVIAIAITSFYACSHRWGMSRCYLHR